MPFKLVKPALRSSEMIGAKSTSGPGHARDLVASLLPKNPVGGDPA
jgi:hypothetical protein